MKKFQIMRVRDWIFLIYWAGLGGLFGAGCSQVEFNSVPPEACSSLNSSRGSGACTTGPQGTENYKYTVATGDVDILFVDDNSGSMYVEQEKMANQFPDFLNSISRLSYQIAITSTDVSQGGLGQDGRFFSFGNGQSILKNSSRKKDSTHYQNIPLFQNTIKRSETGNGDERGIYAAVRAMQRAENRDFFRPGAHLAIVILSDEDERSSGGGAPGSDVNGGPISDSYRAQTNDLPEALVSVAKEVLPPTESFSVHSIIIRPGDTSCHNSQNSQGGGVKGFYGTQYARLSQASSTLRSLGPLKPGTLGNICSSNYTNEMGQIAQYLKTSVLQLPCKPLSGTLRVTYLDAVPSNQTEFVNTSNQVQFSPSLPAGSRVQLEFSCQ